MDNEINERELDLFAQQLKLRFADVEPPSSLGPDQLKRILETQNSKIKLRKPVQRMLATAAIFVVIAGAALVFVLPNMRAKNAAAPMEQFAVADQAAPSAEMESGAGMVDGCILYEEEAEQKTSPWVWFAVAGGSVLLAGFGAGLLIVLKRKR